MQNLGPFCASIILLFWILASAPLIRTQEQSINQKTINQLLLRKY